jgi:hypothetical protein
MFRIAGFIVGSALAITMMLVVLGVPRLSSPVQEPEPVALPDVPKAIELPVEEPLDAVSELVAEEVPMPAETVTETRWHSFWSPFSSQIAANGFVSRLEAVTGYDYRVVKIETGVYEVTFAYADETERRDKLSVIASATGLELPDS